MWVRRYDPFTVNVAAVDVGGGLIVIDTRSTSLEGSQLAQELRELGAPVLGVVNTHHHFDHTFGNSAFRTVPRWAHERCGNRLLARVDGDIDDLAPFLPEELHHDLIHTDIVAPDRLFVTHARTDVGDRPLDLRHLGRGHTDNDIVVVIPDADLVLAGDLIEQSGAPLYEDAFPLAWPATVAALLDLDASTYVPGHGDPVDRDFVARQQREIAEVAGLARAHVEDGTPLEELIAHAVYPADIIATAAERALLELTRGGWSWSRWEGQSWSLDIPTEVLRHGSVRPPPDSDLQTMAIARGWLDDDAVAIVVATVAATTEKGPEQRIAETAVGLDVVEDRGSRPVGSVVGHHVRGDWVLDEALSPSGHERVARIVAAGPHELVSVTVRVPRAATHLYEVADRIIASLELRPASNQA